MSERPRILVGTHHKTGTVLMKKIFERIARKQRLRFLNCSGSAVQGADWDIVYDNHSTFLGLDPAIELRGVHLIRDPRMVVVSSALYHTRSTEKWLHVPRPQFAGRTYQQAINALASDRDRFVFEMEHTAAETIRKMRAWVDRGLPWCIDVKLEHLMVDEGLDTYFRMFRHLGFAGADLLQALRVAHDQSVFNPERRQGDHVRSARPEHWSEYYDDTLLALFRSKFGDVCERLGYD